MTAPRNQGSVEQAILNAIGDLSPKAIEEATGKTPSTFYKISNPQGGLELSLKDAAALDAALLNQGVDAVFGPLLAEIRDRVVDRIGGRAQKAPVDIESALRRTHIEAGHLSEAVDDSMADGRLTPAERRRIAREAQELMDWARTIRDAVEPPAEVGPATVDTIIRRSA